MSNIVRQKGSGFSGGYTGATIPTATDWAGTISIHREYPGSVIISKALTQSPDLSKLLFSFDAADILGLDAGVYTLAGHLVSPSLGEDSYRIDYLTVTEAVISSQPMTIITMTIAKLDGTPTGTAAKALRNTDGLASVVNEWKGVQVTAKQSEAYNIGTDIISIETISTETNAAGYAQLPVIKGSTVTVSCPAFGKSVTIDTTGLDTIDLSSSF